MAFIPSTTRPLLPDPVCRILAVYQAPGGGKSGEMQCKGYLLEADGCLSGELITERSLRKLQNVKEKIVPKETERADQPWKSIDKASWGAKVAAKIASLLPGANAGLESSSEKTYIASGVRELFFENHYNSFLKFVKPKAPEYGLGLVQDRKGRTIIFVVIKLIVADTLEVIKKSGGELTTGVSMDVASAEAKVVKDTSVEQQFVGPSTNPVILKRTFLRMAWDKQGNPLETLHGDEKHDGVVPESGEPDEDAKVEVEEEGFLNLEEFLDSHGESHSSK